MLSYMKNACCVSYTISGVISTGEIDMQPAHERLL
jgi:hypothetical protein